MADDYPSDAELNAYLASNLLGWTDVRWYSDKRIYAGKRPGGQAVTPVFNLTMDPAQHGELLQRLVAMHGYQVTIGPNESKTMVEVVIYGHGNSVQAEGRTVGQALARAAWLAHETMEW